MQADLAAMTQQLSEMEVQAEHESASRHEATRALHDAVADCRAAQAAAYSYSGELQAVQASSAIRR